MHRTNNEFDHDINNEATHCQEVNISKDGQANMPNNIEGNLHIILISIIYANIAL